MSTCHQAHNIPWNTFLELLHKVPYETNSPREIDGLFRLCFDPDGEGKVFSRVRFFANKIAKTIKEFSETERKKFSNEDVDSISIIYDKESCNEWLLEGKLQELSGWTALNEGGFSSHPREPFLETVKELFIQEKVGPLLRLARNGVKLQALEFCTYSNFFHYGIGRIKEDCLTLYIHLNILIAKGTLREPSQWHHQWKQFLNDEILRFYDGNSNARMYQEYFQKNPDFEDLEGLNALLKKLFRMLYLYDMVLGECGKQTNWENEVLSCVGGYYRNYTKGTSQVWYDQCEAHEKKSEK